MSCYVWMLKKFNLVQHENLIMIKVLNCKGGTALRRYRLCFIVLCGLMDNFQHFYVMRPIWSVIMSGQYPKKRSESADCIRCAGGEMGHEDESSWLWPVSPLVTTPCPVLALFLSKLSLAVQMLNFLNKS